MITIIKKITKQPTSQGQPTAAAIEAKAEAMARPMAKAACLANARAPLPAAFSVGLGVLGGLGGLGSVGDFLDFSASRKEGLTSSNCSWPSGRSISSGCSSSFKIPPYKNQISQMGLI